MATDPKDLVRALGDALTRQDGNRVGRLTTPDFSYPIMSCRTGTPADRSGRDDRLEGAPGKQGIRPAAHRPAC